MTKRFIDLYILSLDDDTKAKLRVGLAQNDEHWLGIDATIEHQTQHL